MTARVPRLRAPLVTVSLLTAGVLAFASPAHAEDEVGIDHVESSSGEVSMVVSVDGIPGGGVDPANVTVEIDGRSVAATAKTVAAGDITRSTILVLDASNSMSGTKFAAATVAIDAFLEAAPADVNIGLVAFAGDVVQSIPPTPDRESIRDALAPLQLSKGTNVYDAMLEALDLAGTKGSRSLLLLSDGADTGSATTLDVVSGTAVDQEVVVDVVSLASAAKADLLATVADDTGGSVIPADPQALSTVFADQADALAKQLLVTFESPDLNGKEASIGVTVVADGTTYTDSAFVALGEAGVDVPEAFTQGKALVSEPLMFGGALAVFLGLLGLLTTVLPSRKSAAERRLDAYFDSEKAGNSGRRRAQTSGSADLKDSAVAMTSKLVSRDFETRISQRLAGAGSALTAAEWVLTHAALAIGALAFGFVMSGMPMAVLGLSLGVALPWLYLRFRHRRRLGKFNGQLAQTLGLMAGGLQAGLSLPQAVDSVVREGHEPMAGELKRALIEQRLGIDLTDALDSVGQRMDSADFGWVVMAIKIQREVGGNLAEILHTVADTIRERESLRRQVKALSAEGRLSGYILTALPPLIGVYMSFVNPEYIRLLYTTFAGYILLAAATLLLAVGGFAMSKLAKVEI